MKERVSFNFLEVIKSFFKADEVDYSEIEERVEYLMKQQDNKRLEKLINETDPTKQTKSKKGKKISQSDKLENKDYKIKKDTKEINDENIKEK